MLENMINTQASRHTGTRVPPRCLPSTPPRKAINHFVSIFIFLGNTLGLTPVVSILEMDFSCFLLIFLIFFVSVICGAQRTVSKQRRWQAAGRAQAVHRRHEGGARAHHLIRQALLLVLLLS